MNIKTSASLLASNLADLTAEAARCEQAGVDMLHFDVMDGVFVEQITYGSPVLKCLRSATSLPLDVHLMVENPTNQIKFFADAGADIITVHAESFCDLAAVLKSIRGAGAAASLAVKPLTPIEAVYGLLPLCDMVLVMTVEPGYGGQSFIPSTLEKISALRKRTNELGMPDFDIEVDGGINDKTAALVKQAGANVLVAGTGLFKAADMRAANSALKN